MATSTSAAEENNLPDLIYERYYEPHFVLPKRKTSVPEGYFFHVFIRNDKGEVVQHSKHAATNEDEIEIPFAPNFDPFKMYTIHYEVHAPSGKEMHSNEKQFVWYQGPDNNVSVAKDPKFYSFQQTEVQKRQRRISTYIEYVAFCRSTTTAYFSNFKRYFQYRFTNTKTQETWYDSTDMEDPSFNYVSCKSTLPAGTTIEYTLLYNGDNKHLEMYSGTITTPPQQSETPEILKKNRGYLVLEKSVEANKYALYLYPDGTCTLNKSVYVTEWDDCSDWPREVTVEKKESFEGTFQVVEHEPKEKCIIKLMLPNHSPDAIELTIVKGSALMAPNPEKFAGTWEDVLVATSPDIPVPLNSHGFL